VPKAAEVATRSRGQVEPRATCGGPAPLALHPLTNIALRSDEARCSHRSAMPSAAAAAAAAAARYDTRGRIAAASASTSDCASAGVAATVSM
jgi:hypothetical protein